MKVITAIKTTFGVFIATRNSTCSEQEFLNVLTVFNDSQLFLHLKHHHFVVTKLFLDWIQAVKKNFQHVMGHVSVKSLNKALSQVICLVLSSVGGHFHNVNPVHLNLNLTAQEAIE